jgi:hypothetical protein
LTEELLLRRDNPPSSFLALIGITNRTLAGLNGFLESLDLASDSQIELVMLPSNPDKPFNYS